MDHPQRNDENIRVIKTTSSCNQIELQGRHLEHSQKELIMHILENSNVENAENIRENEKESDSYRKQEEQEVSWVWDESEKSQDVILCNRNKEAYFHPDYSCGTAAVRGTCPLTDGWEYYWEIKMASAVYGTDMMIGVGTKDVDLEKYKSQFCSMLGRDVNSWGLSYFGTFQNGGKIRDFTDKFERGTVIGVHLDMWRGTLCFFKNGRPLGIAARGLQGKVLYPIIASTAARTRMKLEYSRSAVFSLQYQCVKEISKQICNSPTDIDQLPLSKNLKTYLKEHNYWLSLLNNLPPTPGPKRKKQRRFKSGDIFVAKFAQKLSCCKMFSKEDTEFEFVQLRTSTSESNENKDRGKWIPANPDLRTRIGYYMRLSKARLSGLVVLSAMAGYAVAPDPFNLMTFSYLSIGTALCSGAANSFNQLIEVPYDSQMSRTRNRVLVQGLLEPKEAFLFASISSIVGVSVLYFGLNSLTAILGALNIFLYAGVYTPSKRCTIANTWIGSIVGGIPPLMGWAAVSGSLPPGAWVLAAMLYCWQFPHFNSLSWSYRPDYSRAGYRMMAVTDPALCRRVSLRHSIAQIPLAFLMPVLGNEEQLAVNVAKRLGITLASLRLGFFKNKETSIEIDSSVRGRDVFLLQIVDENPNDSIMELLITSYALKTSCANKVVGVIPYLPYSKQSKMRNRGAIPAKLIATMLCRAGMDHVITMDMHSKEIQGFYNCPVDNLRASPFLIQYIQDKVPDYRNAVIVARNPASATRAQSFAERLRLGLAVIHGDQLESDSEIVDGRHSPPPERSRKSSKTFYSEVSSQLIPPGLPIKTKHPMNLVGDVDGKIAIIVEDMIDDVTPVINAAKLLRERGAYTIYVAATHGLLSSNGPALIEDSFIDEVIVSNTIPLEEKQKKCEKIRSVDISPILAEAVRRIHNGESMSYLFRDIPLED
eukprot:gene9089-10058_t